MNMTSVMGSWEVQGLSGNDKVNLMSADRIPISGLRLIQHKMQSFPVKYILSVVLFIKALHFFVKCLIFIISVIINIHENTVNAKLTTTTIY